jgi:hypothetical protein
MMATSLMIPESSANRSVKLYRPRRFRQKTRYGHGLAASAETC